MNIIHRMFRKENLSVPSFMTSDTTEAELRRESRERTIVVIIFVCWCS